MKLTFTKICARLLLLTAVLVVACGERSIGPGNDTTLIPPQNGDIEWISYGIPGASSVSAMALRSDGGLLVGTANHGIYLLADGDSTWQEYQAGIADLSITALAIDVAGNMFAGTATNGLYRRAPTANSWAQLAIPGQTIWSITFTTNNAVLVGALNGTFRSVDNGANWTLANQGITDTILISLAVAGSGQIYGGAAPGGVFTSTDNADSWLPTQLTTLSILSLATDAANTIYAGTLANGLLYSEDQGQNWQVAGNILSPNASINTIVVNRSGHIFAGGEGDGVYRSEDAGSSWERVNDGLANLASHRSIRTMAFSPTQHLFIGTTSGTVYRTRYTTPDDIAGAMK